MGKPTAPRNAAGDDRWWGEIAFLRRVLIVAGVAALALLIWTARDALLLAFAAVLVAVMLRAVADWLQHHLRLPARWGVTAACLVIALPLLAVFVLVGSEVRSQSAELMTSLPQSLEALLGRLGLDGVLSSRSAADASTVGRVAREAAGFAMQALDALGALAVAVVAGVFIAGDPALYRRGVVWMVPRSQQRRVEEALGASGRALRVWLRAQLMAMLAVGVLTGLGAWAIGLPAPLALGLFSGLVDIVPLIGPFIGAIPGLLLAMNQGWETVAWTAAMYLLVQQIEGNLLTPLLGERMLAIPPALLLFSVMAAGAVLGVGGVLLAAPLTVVTMVLVGQLYVRETLGRPVEVPGEHEG